MPPSSLPTGTVGPSAAGTRTFPPGEERAPTATAGDAVGRPSSAAVVPRREHDVTLDNAQKRIEELERQNEALREHIQERDRERQAVVDRYERLLARRRRRGSSTLNHDTESDGLLLRLSRWLGFR